MKTYYIESIISKIAQNIKELAERGILTRDKKIVLYGLDTFSFAMKTVLSNLGFPVESYLCYDTDAVMKYKRQIKATKARYLNSSRDIVRICESEERLSDLDGEILVLSSSRDCPQLKHKERSERKHVRFLQVYDWDCDNFSDAMSLKRKMTLEEIQNVEKEILFHVDKFCIDQKLRYWVCGGTLLGTLRHKGFIPWDDDIDIFMPWEDYKRFVETYKGTKNYELIVPEKTDRKDYYDLWSKVADNRTLVREDLDFLWKVHPVSIDVFPLIGMPEDAQERRRFFGQYSELEKMIWEDFYAHNGDLGVYNQWYPEQKKFLEKYDFDSSMYVGVLGSAYKERDCTTRGAYEVTLRTLFEDMEVNVPGGYKEYLDNLYGKGWEELPDESKRVSHHNMEAYWL